MPELTKAQIDDLSRLLAKTLDFFALEQMVGIATGDDLYSEYVAPDQPLRPMIVKLLDKLEDVGTTDRFLAEVYRQRPLRDDVRVAIAALFPDIPTRAEHKQPAFSVQNGGAPDARFSADMGPGLQKIVRPRLAMLQIAQWGAELDKAMKRVCRVEAHGAGIGTGFLVGEKSVLTNWHVVERLARAGQIGDLGCRFDYLVRADGTIDNGVLVGLGAGGLVASRPYSEGEGRGDPDNPPPAADQLDYALLELADPVGATRGFFALPANAALPAAEAPLIIVQHPQAAVMKFALDTDSVIGPAADNLRLRYRTNTEAGSSGSPCFSFDWAIVALHHFGDPAWRTAPTFNQGIPISLVHGDILAQGHAARLG